MTALALHGYYAILDVRGDVPGPAEASLARARALLGAQPCCLQLRAKDLPVRPFVNLARALAGLCREAGVPFCVNDRLDVAVLAGADVLHLGQEDLCLPHARQILAGHESSMVIGVSTHTLEQAEAAVREGADYIGFGPVFATRSKLRPDAVVGLEGLRSVAARVPVPVVAIGGIRRADVAAVAKSGAAAAAVIADIDQAPVPAEAASEVARLFDAAVERRDLHV